MVIRNTNFMRLENENEVVRVLPTLNLQAIDTQNQLNLLSEL